MAPPARGVAATAGVLVLSCTSLALTALPVAGAAGGTSVRREAAVVPEQRPGLRRLQEALRSLEDRAISARKLRGLPYSRREAAKETGRLHPRGLDARRIGEWLSDPGRTPRDADQVWALVRVWAGWANDVSQQQKYWNHLVEQAQPDPGGLAPNVVGATTDPPRSSHVRRPWLVPPHRGEAHDRLAFPGVVSPAGYATLGTGSSGVLPAVWNVPARSRVFTGRDSMLIRLHEQLRSSGAAVVQALHGMGGVGKTLLAIEYIHRHADDYDAVWWIDAERISLVEGQFAEFAVAAGVATAGLPVPAAAAAVSAAMRQRDRWLVAFDNADDPVTLRPWLPQGPGQVLLTSRNPGWTQVACPIEVTLFTRVESIRLLQELVPSVADEEADRVADKVGDLPLAVAQAGGTLAETHMKIDDYLIGLDTESARVLEIGVPATYPVPLTAVVRDTTGRLTQVDPIATQILQVCTFLAPEAIPPAWFTALARQEPAAMPKQLASLAGRAFTLYQVLGRLAKYGLARMTPEGPLVHRLTAAITRQALEPDQHDRSRRIAERLIVNADPGNPYEAATWPAWALMLPHLNALNLAATTDMELRRLACNAIHFQAIRGSYREAHDLASALHLSWVNFLGADQPDTLSVAHRLAWILNRLGRYPDARALSEDNLARRRRVLGPDDPNTLRTAANLAWTLDRQGEYSAARTLAEDALVRQRRVLGFDHLQTFNTADTLAAVLAHLGEYSAARALAEDTLTRRRRVLGEDHPRTLNMAADLASTLDHLGEYGAARTLAEDALARQQRVLGDEHPATLKTADVLAIVLGHSGELQAAYALYKDTYRRRCRVLGENHPDTLESAHVFAATLSSGRWRDSAEHRSEE